MPPSLQQFLMAVMFFTRLPVARWVRYDATLELGMPRFFPLVGLLVGGLHALLLLALAHWLPWLPALVLASGLAILLTGAFHEDGFADMCDGFGGGWSKEQVLFIMKDSRLGTYGSLGLVLMLASKLSLLYSLQLPAAIPALLAGHVLSRTMATSLLLSLPYVRDTEDPAKIKTPPCQLDRNGLLFMLACSVPLLYLLPASSWLPLIAGLVALRQALAWYYRKRIGGYTGDCLGGAQQLGEILVLAICCAAAA